MFFPNRFSPNTTLAYYLNLFTLHFSNFFGLIYELKPQLFNFKVLLMKCLFTHLYGVNNSHKRKHSIAVTFYLVHPLVAAHTLEIPAFLYLVSSVVADSLQYFEAVPIGMEISASF